MKYRIYAPYWRIDSKAGVVSFLMRKSKTISGRKKKEKERGVLDMFVRVL
jgi:hypothetical protein